MEPTTLPPMTQWQFYAMFGVQFVLGLCYAIGMFFLAIRDPKLGWTSSASVQKLRDKLGFGLLIAAGVLSYFSLRDVYDYFVGDVSTAVSEAVVNTAGEVIDGTYHAPDPHALQHYLSGVIWGEPDSYQREMLIMMALFWISLGWCAYVFDDKSSPVSVVKKAIKGVAYVLLTVLMYMVPMCLHRFGWDEIRAPLIIAALAAAGIAVTHTYHRALPPPLPDEEAA